MIKNKVVLNWLYVLLINIALLGVVAHAFDEIKIFSYIDELIGLFGIILGTIFFLKTKLNKHLLIFFGLFSGLMLLSLGVSIVNDIQGVYYILLDLVANIKFVFQIVFVYLIFKEYDFNSHVTRIINNEVSLIIFVFVVFSVLSLTTDIFPYTEVRHGIPCLRIFFPNFTVYCAILIFFLLFTYGFETRHRIIKLITLTILIAFTMRSKAIAFALIFWAFYFLNHIRNKIGKTLIITLMFISIFYFCFDQFVFYFLDKTESARNMLFITSFKVAADFPLGAGFATYGSASSSFSYSNLYYMYGLDKTYGLSPIYSGYISDSFWPMIIGQFGYGGLIVVIALILYAYYFLFQIKDKRVKNTGLFALTFLLVDTLAESAFVNPIALLFAFIIGVCFAKNGAYKPIVSKKES